MRVTVEWAAVGLATLLASGVAWAQRAPREVPGLLFGGGTLVSAPVAQVDPLLPRGHRITWRARPESTLSRCSLTQPVCVHSRQASQLDPALEQLAAAYREWVYVWGRPAPLGDGALGGGPELDLYLSAQKPSAQKPSAQKPSAQKPSAAESVPSEASDSGLQVWQDAPALSADETSVACVLDPGFAETAASFRQCVAQASAARLDAAAGPGIRRGWAQYQSLLLDGLDNTMLAAVDDAQSNPQLAVLTASETRVSDAGLLFWAYADSGLSVAEPGKLSLAVLGLSRAWELPVAAHPEWDNIPDVLDVFRRAFDNDAPRVADFFAGFAVSRLFLGDRSDAAHAPGLPGLGPWGRVRFDWTLPYTSLPRHVAGPYPIEPLGAAYVWLDLDSVPLTARLGFRAEWEEPVSFKWMVVSVDAQGREMNRWDVPYIAHGTRVEKTIMNFQGASGLVFVGVNLGAIDLSHPFDPDQGPWEPHAYSVYVTELPP